jgi:hypothetical protein
VHNSVGAHPTGAAEVQLAFVDGFQTGVKKKVNMLEM